MSESENEIDEPIDGSQTDQQHINVFRMFYVNCSV